jgi:quinoprotein glucose dehydrogenase
VVLEQQCPAQTRHLLETAGAFRYAAFAGLQNKLMTAIRCSRVTSLCLLAAGSLYAVSRSVWEGVYTKEQAQRGQAAYRENCAKCHGENLGGGEAGPALAGGDFLKSWNGRTAGDLFALIRKTMPSEDPGSLSTREYSDLVALIFSVNEFPPGSKELDREVNSLNEIRIEAKR